MSRPALYTSVGRNNTPMYRTLNRALRGADGICDHGDETPIFADAPFCLIQPMTIDLGHRMVFVECKCAGRFETLNVPVKANQIPVLRKPAALRCIESLGEDGRVRWRPEDHCDHINNMMITTAVRKGGKSLRDPHVRHGEAGLIYLIMCKKCRTVKEIELFPLDFDYIFEDSFVGSRG